MSTDARAAFDGGDDGFHEIQLNGKQLVFLGMATTLVSVVIFLCGVLVGRGVKPIDTVAQAAGPQAFDVPAMTAAVPPGTVSTPAPAPVPPPAPVPTASTAAAAAAATPTDDDTQPTPVGDDPEPAAPASEPAAPAAARASIESKAAKATAKPEPPKPAAKPVQATAVPPAVKPPTPTPTPAPTPAAAAAMASTAPATSNGSIAVQVGAFNTRHEADALAKRLSSKGYAVYVMNPTGHGKTVYRVRVGNYATADEAKNVSTRLTQQEKLKPWITR
jgi:DedD protein